MGDSMPFRTARGGCHCGAVQFEVDLPEVAEVRRCNCSICRMSGYLHLTVARRDFRLLSGEDVLTEYRFNTGVARHLFCRTCGIKSFYVPRSHPHAWSVNLNCLEVLEEVAVQIEDFDGSNWEVHVHEIRHLGT